jgi:hypothetical protein
VCISRAFQHSVPGVDSKPADCVTRQEHPLEFAALARAAFDKFDIERKGGFTAKHLKRALQTTRKCYAQGGEVTDALVAELVRALALPFPRQRQLRLCE